MSEVKKLYELAGIENYSIKGWTGFVPNKYKIIADDDDNVIDIVLDFTAEKQIAILIFILNKFGDIGFQKMYSITGNDESTRKDFIKCLCDCEHETWDSRPVDFYYQKGASGDNLKESLAGLINSLWQDLTEEEQEQIRSILNG